MECLTECGGSVASGAGNFILTKIKTHIGYLFDYDNNKKGLEDARVKLEVKRSDASQLVEDASTKFRDVSSAVTHWRNEADKFHEEAQRTIADYNRRSLLSLYLSSKNAWELTQQINEMVQNAPNFGTSFDRSSPDSGHAFNLAGSMEFESRLSVLEGLLEALKDEKVSMCSICGMGGVGKTTLAKKLIQQVEKLHLFDKVIMITVSQNPNFEKIQNEIIELLGLKIDESSMPARAYKLNDRLTNNKTLLILDDVWRMLDDENFEAIGIPSVSNGCKIVFTSRNEDECKKMGSQRNFRVGVLEDGEAWDMFRKFAGKCTDYVNLCGIARKIAAQCDGLPIAIVTIATTLKDKPEGIWSDSLRQLQKSNLSGISDMEKVYFRIKLSYDLLDNKEAQSCFLLCCLYPEDYNIPIEDLVLYGKSLDLFETVANMTEARDRVESIMFKLKTSFLLLDGESDECVKMHDIVRDFAVSFSSKTEFPYLTACENIVRTNWPETTKYENCSAISIMCEKMQNHPVDLQCPQLELLQLAFGCYSECLDANIFRCMEKLKVLSLNVPSLLQSFTVPKKLNALFIMETEHRLYKYSPLEIKDLIGGHLMNLEFFSFSSSRLCKDFPMEIGLMYNLRVLRFAGVSFEYIPPGLLPKLVHLEELYLPLWFLNWGQEEYRGRRMNASVDEIESLSLTSLQIGVPRGSILAEKLVKNLTRFQVYLGSDYCADIIPGSNSKTVHVYVVDAFNTTWISPLLRKSEILSFVGVKNLKNITCLQLEQVKEIRIWECEQMEYLLDRAAQQILWRSSFSQLERLELWKLYNLKEICHNFSKIEATLFFRNLIEMHIFGCVKLKSVFPLSLASGLSQLQQIDIRGCDEMEKVIYTDEVDDDNQQEGEIVQFNPAPETISTMNPTPNSIRGLQGRGKRPIRTPNQQLMEENSAKSDKQQEDATIIFPQLKILQLGRMPKLRVFCDFNRTIKLPSFESLSINECNEMEAFSYGSCTTPILQQIDINYISQPVGEDVNAILKEMLDSRNNIKQEDVTGNDAEQKVHGEIHRLPLNLIKINGRQRARKRTDPCTSKEKIQIEQVQVLE